MLTRSCHLLRISPLVLLILLPLFHPTESTKPSGEDHICKRVETYMDKVEVLVEEPVQLKRYEWCVGVPPRCSVFITELRNRTKHEAVEKNRTVSECCGGFVEINSECVPECPPNQPCPNMKCQDTKHCFCLAGYTGLHCNTTCPVGRWGSNCTSKCQCGETNGNKCHHLTGRCILPATTVIDIETTIPPKGTILTTVQSTEVVSTEEPVLSTPLTITVKPQVITLDILKPTESVPRYTILGTHASDEIVNKVVTHTEDIVQEFNLTQTSTKPVIDDDLIIREIEPILEAVPSKPIQFETQTQRTIFNVDIPKIVIDSMYTVPTKEKFTTTTPKTIPLEDTIPGVFGDIPFLIQTTTSRKPLVDNDWIAKKIDTNLEAIVNVFETTTVKPDPNSDVIEKDISSVVSAFPKTNPVTVPQAVLTFVASTVPASLETPQPTINLTSEIKTKVIDKLNLPAELDKSFKSVVSSVLHTINSSQTTSKIDFDNIVNSLDSGNNKTAFRDGLTSLPTNFIFNNLETPGANVFSTLPPIKSRDFIFPIKTLPTEPFNGTNDPSVSHSTQPVSSISPIQVTVSPSISKNPPDVSILPPDLAVDPPKTSVKPTLSSISPIPSDLHTHTHLHYHHTLPPILTLAPISSNPPVISTNLPSIPTSPPVPTNPPVIFANTLSTITLPPRNTNPPAILTNIPEISLIPSVLTDSPVELTIPPFIQTNPTYLPPIMFTDKPVVHTNPPPPSRLPPIFYNPPPTSTIPPMLRDPLTSSTIVNIPHNQHPNIDKTTTKLSLSESQIIIVKAPNDNFTESISPTVDHHFHRPQSPDHMNLSIFSPPSSINPLENGPSKPPNPLESLNVFTSSPSNRSFLKPADHSPPPILNPAVAPSDILKSFVPQPAKEPQLKIFLSPEAAKEPSIESFLPQPTLSKRPLSTLQKIVEETITKNSVDTLKIPEQRQKENSVNIPTIPKPILTENPLEIPDEIPSVPALKESPEVNSAQTPTGVLLESVILTQNTPPPSSTLRTVTLKPPNPELDKAIGVFENSLNDLMKSMEHIGMKKAAPIESKAKASRYNNIQNDGPGRDMMDLRLSPGVAVREDENEFMNNRNYHPTSVGMNLIFNPPEVLPAGDRELLDSMHHLHNTGLAENSRYEPYSSKVLPISVSTLAVFLILALAVVCYVFHRRRKARTLVVATHGEGGSPLSSLAEKEVAVSGPPTGGFCRFLNPHSMQLLTELQESQYQSPPTPQPIYEEIQW